MKKKNKMQPRFAIVRRGYDVESVEAYISLEREKADRAGLEQKERIRVLKAQCDRLSEELDVYRGREEQIKSALITASEQAEKTVLDVKLRYAMELERLKLFRAKWTGAYEEIKQRYGFAKDTLNMESVAVSVKLELERFLAHDFSLDKGIPAEDTERTGRRNSPRRKPPRAGTPKPRARRGKRVRLSRWKRRVIPPKVLPRYAAIWGSGNKNPFRGFAKGGC